LASSQLEGEKNMLRRKIRIKMTTALIAFAIAIGIVLLVGRSETQQYVIFEPPPPPPPTSSVNVEINLPAITLPNNTLPPIQFPTLMEIDEWLAIISEAAPAYDSPFYGIHDTFQPAIVDRIIDGDTIVVIMSNGDSERVRFIGVDAPEMGRFGVEEGAEPGAIEARDFVAELIPPGSIVWLESVGNDRDRFERLRRYIWMEMPYDAEAQRETLTVNRLLLEHGHAVVRPRQ